jgi:histidyl-tRNA synthetase
MGERAYTRASQLARELRRRGHSIEVAPDDVKLKKSMDIASRLGMKYVLIIGERELESNSYPLRNMNTGEQWTVTIDDLVYLYSHRTMKFMRGDAGAVDMKETSQ